MANMYDSDASIAYEIDHKYGTIAHKLSTYSSILAQNDKQSEAKDIQWIVDLIYKSTCYLGDTVNSVKVIYDSIVDKFNEIYNELNHESHGSGALTTDALQIGGINPLLECEEHISANMIIGLMNEFMEVYEIACVNVVDRIIETEKGYLLEIETDYKLVDKHNSAKINKKIERENADISDDIDFIKKGINDYEKNFYFKSNKYDKIRNKNNYESGVFKFDEFELVKFHNKIKSYNFDDVFYAMDESYVFNGLSRMLYRDSRLPHYNIFDIYEGCDENDISITKISNTVSKYSEIILNILEFVKNCDEEVQNGTYSIDTKLEEILANNSTSSTENATVNKRNNQEQSSQSEKNKQDDKKKKKKEDKSQSKEGLVNAISTSIKKFLKEDKNTKNETGAKLVNEISTKLKDYVKNKTK